MKKLYAITILLLTVGLATAQKFSIKGTVSDTLNNPMPSATVMLLNPKDSSLVNFGVTNTTGAFEIKNVNKGTYQLKISFVGFATFTKDFSTPETGTVMEIGRLKLKPASTDLADIVIKGERNPVTVKRDTIEFNAGSFKTKQNANVEDLLKKMPGIEVDSDGGISAQGETVQQVTVDGREFFGRDPKLATRNLPADAVEKVQVFDKKSDQSAFTGIDDGSKTKTINLELKEEKRNAAFGSLMAGGGTEDRFTGKASINRFNKGSQLSFLGMGNNINEQGFSIGDAINFSGGNQQMGGGGGGSMTINIGGGGNSNVPTNFGGRQNGIMTNYAGGLNFNKDFNEKKTQLGGNYFYSWLEQNIDKDLFRQTSLGDNSNNYSSNSRTISQSESHRANLILDHKIDSVNSVKLTSNLSYSDSEQASKSIDYLSFLNGDTIRTVDQSSYSHSIAKSLNNNLLWRHRFAKKGRSVSINGLYNVSDTDNDGGVDGEILVKNKPDSIVLQQNNQSTLNQTWGGSISYTEPLGNRKYLEFNYNFRDNQNTVDRNVDDIDPNGEISPNTIMSSEYSSHYVYHRPGINLRVNRLKYNFSVGASYQSTRLKGDGLNGTSPFTINNPFQNVLTVARFNYDFSTFKHLRLDYETSMQEPTINQLQPVIDNSNQSNIYVGNPDLKPAYVQSTNLNFTTFDPAKFINFFAMAMVRYQTNAIINSQNTDADLIRTTKPVNVKNALNASLNLNYGFRIQKLLSRFNLGASASQNQGINLIDNEETDIAVSTLGGNARYNFTFKEIFILDLSANIRSSNTDNESKLLQDQKFINSTYTAETNITVLKNWQLAVDYNYFIYDSKTTDFKQSLPIMNIWLSRFLLKANAGEIRVGVSNLFDKSLGITQTAAQNYIQQERLNNLGRYFMISFTYALNKQLNPMGGGGGRRGGGGMRIMMQN